MSSTDEETVESTWATHILTSLDRQCNISFNVNFSTQEEYCPAMNDGLSCWPLTKSGTVAVIPCFPEFNSIKYSTADNATRRCLSNGTWESSSNYSNCKPIPIEGHEILKDDWNVNEATMFVYYFGFSLSLVALTIALTIFLYFKDLRCLRNTFHANLMLTYILVDLMWIITAYFHAKVIAGQSGMCTMVIFLYYFQGTNFFWMFVEGFYLYLLVVRTFTVDQVKFPVYMVIGWGAPAIVVAVWVAVKAQLATQTLHPIQHPLAIEISLGCPWMEEHDYDWIFFTPILIVLFVNVIFLINIMRVLITKLRAATVTVETQQYRKAAKALLVLIPLLGVTYILVITAPKEGFSSVVFAYIRSILISTQGLTVSILYCFLNAEVRNTLRHHWQRWCEKRSIGCPSRHSLKCFGDASCHSQAESLRLSTRLRERNDRDSCTSYVTSNSYVGNGATTTVVPVSSSSLLQDSL